MQQVLETKIQLLQEVGQVVLEINAAHTYIILKMSKLLSAVHPAGGPTSTQRG